MSDIKLFQIQQITQLNQRLTVTDHPIDQVVYKLYTDEEIVIVEGSG